MKCNAVNADGSKFCIQCGSKLTTQNISCPKCGKQNASGSKFCINCGNNLTETSITINLQKNRPLVFKVPATETVSFEQPNLVKQNPVVQTQISEGKKAAAQQIQQQRPQTSISGKNFFKKFKIPLLILAGALFSLLCIIILERYKYVFSKSNVEDSRTYEDKFERLWVIGSSRDYTEDDFKGWNKEDLRILRNYFFARNNFRFGSKELTNYFSKYSWYQALYSDVGDMFSDLQTNNVQFIKKLEGLPNYHH